MRAGIGICGGALAALLYHAAGTDRTPGTSAGSVADISVDRPNSEPTGFSNRVPGAAVADTLPEEYRESFASTGDWAFFDPAGFFAHAEGADSIDGLINGLEVLIATDPARVFELVARFEGKGSREIDELYLNAIRGMAGLEPTATIARMQAIANGPRRDPILAAIGKGFATIDPDAALQWAASITPPAPDALDSVLETVASTDLLRAYQLMQQVQDRVANAELLGYAMGRSALASGQSADEIVSTLVRRSEPDADVIARSLMQGWMLEQPEKAVAWMNANEVYLTDELTQSAVSSLAFNDVTLAAALTDSVPISAQGQWLSEVAARYGQFDIEAALGWLPKYESRPYYTEILNRTLLGKVRVPGASANVVADFIATTNADISYETVMRTGYSYADSEPEAAMQWALELSNPEYAGWAAASAVERWGGADAPAAQRFTLDQPPGPVRDQMLSALLQGGVFYEGLDRRELVRAHTSPAAAQESIHMFILRDVINRRNVTAESRADVEWMLEQLTDPELRREAEETIAEEWE